MSPFNILEFFQSTDFNLLCSLLLLLFVVVIILSSVVVLTQYETGLSFATFVFSERHVIV
jgi:hypothetical protein